MEAPEVDNVRVVVRCRPMNETEEEQGYRNVVTVDSRANSVSIANPDDVQVIDISLVLYGPEIRIGILPGIRKGAHVRKSGTNNGTPAHIRISVSRVLNTFLVLLRLLRTFHFFI